MMLQIGILQNNRTIYRYSGKLLLRFSAIDFLSTSRTDHIRRWQRNSLTSSPKRIDEWLKLSMNINADKRREPNVDPITDEDLLFRLCAIKRIHFPLLFYSLFFIDRYQFKCQFLSEWTKIDFLNELFASLLKIPNSRWIET